MMPEPHASARLTAIFADPGLAFRRSAIGWLHDLESMGADTWEPMPTVMNTRAATIPGARQVIWPGQSHFATMTAPALFADALRSFFGTPTM